MFASEKQTANRKRTWSWAQQESENSWRVTSVSSCRVSDCPPCMLMDESEPLTSLDSFNSNHATVCVRFDIDTTEDEADRGGNVSSTDSKESNDSPKSQLAKLDTISSYLKHSSTVMQKVVYDKKRRICMQQSGWEDDSCFSVGPGCPI
mmetsp:Transcript_25938/g.58554  ORF Transcript_25938/g.58554 Transcript_25938/m.58554 type:complete len:149 (+) Transcript_25938:379-825(+)